MCRNYIKQALKAWQVERNVTLLSDLRREKLQVCSDWTGRKGDKDMQRLSHWMRHCGDYFPPLSDVGDEVHVVLESGHMSVTSINSKDPIN